MSDLRIIQAITRLFPEEIYDLTPRIPAELRTYSAGAITLPIATNQLMHFD